MKSLCEIYSHRGKIVVNKYASKIYSRAIWQEARATWEKSIDCRYYLIKILALALVIAKCVKIRKTFQTLKDVKTNTKADSK